MLSQCTSVVVAAYGLRGATHHEPWQSGVSAFGISGMPRGYPSPPDFLPLSLLQRKPVSRVHRLGGVS